MTAFSIIKTIAGMSLYILVMVSLYEIIRFLDEQEEKERGSK